jgi:rhodanese-related sulfurtransferase/glyoxylase-like metal-dependent hydrolase (beta-lactamase superfamily II)
MPRTACLLSWLLFGLVPGQPSPASEDPKLVVTDAESAAHVSAAAHHEVVGTYSYPGFRVVQFNLAVLSHYSYVLASEGEALIVDPDRDPSAYIDLVKKEKLAVRGVFLTHSHADFVAGHLELANAFPCPVYQSASSGAEYPTEPLREGSTLAVGRALVRFLETPGHTPDGMCAVVHGTESPNLARAVFTGDTLFVGSIGRPDLLEGRLSAAALAAMAFDTWTAKLSKLNDAATVFPAHGAGSLCGAHLSDRPCSTIGEERRANPYLQHQGRSQFIAAVLEDLPEAPAYFGHNAALNRKGPALVEWNAPLSAEVRADEALLDSSRHALVDLRIAADYFAGHLSGAMNIGLRGRLETWVGTLVPWGTHVVLVGSPSELREAIFRLHRVGYDQPAVLAAESWTKAGLPLVRSDVFKPRDLFDRMGRGDAPVIVDVRLPSEWMGLRLGPVVNLPLNHLRDLAAKLDPSQPVVTVCNSAYRSSMAVGILETRGFKEVASLDGGTEAWIAAGLPVFGAEAREAAAAPRREVRLADRLLPRALQAMILDLPGSFDLVDIRPPAQFSDYQLPGSRNVEIADLLNDPSFLTGAGPLVIVDRDGTLALMVAGILSQKTQRPVKALQGGLEAWWTEFELGQAVREVPLGAPAPAKEAQPPARPGLMPIQPPAPPAAPAAKKKATGC